MYGALSASLPRIKKRVGLIAVDCGTGRASHPSDKRVSAFRAGCSAFSPSSSPHDWVRKMQGDCRHPATNQFKTQGVREVSDSPRPPRTARLRPKPHMDGTIEPSCAMSSPIAPRGERVRHGVGKEPTVHTHSWGVQRSIKNDRKLVRSASVTGITAERARGGLAVDELYIPFGESRHSAETQCCAMICLCLRGSENDSHKLD